MNVSSFTLVDYFDVFTPGFNLEIFVWGESQLSLSVCMIFINNTKQLIVSKVYSAIFLF